MNRFKQWLSEDNWQFRRGKLTKMEIAAIVVLLILWGTIAYAGYRQGEWVLPWAKVATHSQHYQDNTITYNDTGGVTY